MRSVLSLLLIVSIVFMFEVIPAFAQENIQTDGYNTIYYPNGKKLSEGFLRDGKPDGYWRTYYTTGVLKSEGNRKNFLLDSIWVFYNSIGDTIKKLNYLIGKRNGYYFEYNTDRNNPDFVGKVITKELYVNDIRVGNSFYYYYSGKLKEKCLYESGVKEGSAIEYAEDGRVIAINDYRKGEISDRQKINRFDKDGKKVGEWRIFYEGTKVETIANYKDDLLDGYYKKYSQNGLLVLTIFYKGGKLVEEVKENTTKTEIRDIVDNNGKILESGSYKGNVRVGVHKYYNADGKITSSKIFTDDGILLSDGLIDEEGKREGNWVSYYGDGNTRERGIYKNNYKEGNWIFYFKNGSLEQEGNYLRGKENGVWKWYFPTKELRIEEEYYNGKAEGTFVEYDILGNIISKGNNYDGEREGLWETKINDFKSVGNYVSGFRDGKWKYFYNDGTLMFDGNFIQGNPDGSHRYYFPNAQLKEEQYYSGGIPDKHWKKFDQEGNLTITITYVRGKEYRINGEKIDLQGDKVIIFK